MKKFVKGALCAGLALTMLAATGCTHKQANDPENRQLKLATGALDGNFNPFTYTSANDGEMVGMTQLSLLTVNSKGEIVCGENEVCAAKSMKKVYKNASGTVVNEGDKNGSTEYHITIKNGIKFSDGVHELTIKDVLFNLYVYLDPAYTGSTTIYSTNIIGLKRYRLQDPEADEKGGSLNFDSSLTGEVDDRINAIVEWSSENGPETQQVKEDVALTKELFKEEVESDWSAVYASWEENYKSYYFDEAWKAYLFQEGLVEVQERLNPNTNTYVPIYFDADNDNKFDSNKGDKYYTTLDPWQEGARGATELDWENGEIGAKHFIEEMEEATSEEEINKYLAGHANASEEQAKIALQREACIETVVSNYTDDDNIWQVVQYWATGSNLYDKILGQLRTKKYQELKEQNGGLYPKNIEGISTYKDGDYDVLKIEIYGIDPKAEYNFSFPIAPLYYYSSTNYNGKNYVQKAMEDTKNEEFGIEFGDSNFFQNVISSKDKGVPVGAGAYKAADMFGNDNPSKDEFNLDLNNCYFKRNEYFETVGDKVQNAKIKYVNYQVVQDTQIMDKLKLGEIDLGKPNATNANQTEVSKQRNTLSQVAYDTGGYGYVGINPKFVPEYKVRQAIMKAIDTSLAITDFYGSDLAKPIYRPMSTTSWAYPDGVTEHKDIAFDNTPDHREIQKLMTEAGYVLKGGKYVKDHIVDDMANSQLNTTVKLTFIIAGDSTDHPAYSMFTTAANILNSLGFDIKVNNDPQALKNLISGDLAVWAAAWTSSSDPDMYQIYHKESSASSVNNWNYKNIIKGTDNTWEHEMGIINKLSDKIDEGRTYLNRDQRAPIYWDCLDLIMDLAVELPIYQRKDLCVYNKTVIDAKTLVKSPNHYIGLFDKLWEINYV